MADKYDAYECPCGGTGRNDDPTLRDNATTAAAVQRKTCPYCDGFGAIYVLKGYEPPRYALARMEAAQP